MPNPPKQVRLAEIYRRLSAAPASATAEKAMELLRRTIDDVEDEMTDLPNNQGRIQDDSRIYPPAEEFSFPVAGRPDLVRYRHVRHNTFLRDNGAIEIREAPPGGRVMFEKAGADGRKVTDP